MKIAAIILLVLGFFSVNLIAQPQLSTKSKRAIVLYQEALAHANRYNLEKAIQLLEEALKDDPKFMEAIIFLGEIYGDNHQDSLAILTLKKSIAINPTFFPPIYSNIARLEFDNGMYEDALEHITTYFSFTSQNPKFRAEAELLKKSCEFALVAVKHPVPFDPHNLGPNINTKYDQYWPSLSADEQTLVFTNLLPIDPHNEDVYLNRQEDFFYSTFENGQWTPADRKSVV